MPVSSDWVRASRGHAATQAGSSQSLQVTDTLISWFSRTTRILDFNGLKTPSFVMAQMYSQTWHPVHFSGSAETNFLS
jgi:hypothetical protein